MKKIALIWISGATIVALVTTFLEIQPALTFIRILTDDMGHYPVFSAVGATMIGLILPLLIVMLINYIIQNKKNKLPPNFVGKTGIVIKRERELANAALMYSILINAEQKAKVGMGKSVFIELEPGTYSVQTKLGNKIYSPQVPVNLDAEKILSFQTKTDFNKSFTTIIPKGEMLFLAQVPFSN